MKEKKKSEPLAIAGSSTRTPQSSPNKGKSITYIVAPSPFLHGPSMAKLFEMESDGPVDLHDARP